MSGSQSISSRVELENGREFLAELSRLKGVPMWKVIRNAARDFVFEAQRSTPKASVQRGWYFAENPRARHPYAKKYIPMNGDSERIRLYAWRVPVYTGLSRHSWYGAIQAVKGGTKGDGMSRARKSLGKNSSSPYVEFINSLSFSAPSRQSSPEEILQAGFRKAATTMARSWEKEMLKLWR